MRDDRARLQDIREAIARTESRTQGTGRQAFERDELIQVWVVHHLQIIGEAARGLSDEFRSRNPQIPWLQIIGMRHILVHQYFHIDLQIVWNVIEKDLPVLNSEIDALLSTP